MTQQEAMRIVDVVQGPPKGWEVTMNAAGGRALERAYRILGCEVTHAGLKRLLQDVIVYDDIGGDPPVAITDWSKTIFVFPLQTDLCSYS